MLNIKSKKGKVKSTDAFKIVIQGVVQGVGFRPFIYRLAQRMNICGWVSNTSSGVFIQAESNKDKVYEFISRIYEEKPHSAVIESIQVDESEYEECKSFEIRESSLGLEKKTLVLTDIATCPDCLEELFNPKDRRYLYPFINCTQCGPRFTIIKDVPYDRKNTTMDGFQMCDRCQKEYDDSNTRRFHAQPDACWECGPQMKLIKNDGSFIEESSKVIEKTAQLIKQGAIIAIKSLGGYQLACNALDEEIIAKLRQRKGRISKPFAVMVRGVKMAEEYINLNDKEKSLLLSYKRPILLLRKKDSSIASSVAPDNNYLGCMLPFSPIHYILFKYLDIPLVMTSGNITDEPIYYKDDQVYQKLENIADYFLTNNREINVRCDDSVTRIFISLDGNLNKEYLIRRARGYAPMPLDIEYDFSRPVLAVGGYLKNVFAYGKNNHFFMSQHIGDLDNEAAISAFEEGIEHFKKIFDINCDIIASDMHPEYYSTRYAKDLADSSGKKLIQVQHHHAHIVSCMAENNLHEKVIGIALDGTGFGEDGYIWGGEVMIADLKEFQRAAHLEYVHQPGAEAAVKNPNQMAVSWLYHSFGEDIFKQDNEFISRIGKDKINNIITMIESGINTPLTSSVGRLFAAVSSILGICDQASFHAEAEMKLEQFQDEHCREAYGFEILKDKKELIISASGVIRQIIDDIKKTTPKKRIAAKFHNGLVDVFYKLAQRLKRKHGIDKVCLSGGVFQNIVLLTKLYDCLVNKGFKVYIQGKVPANDGGLCLGQAVIANEILKG
ncbi:MAG: carbamoyltransferase HypF [Candidatus Saelkia tenebricola]|nr:carbamoyltransferase HypF [Candidatus Saelkia tenebricola]